MLAPYTCGAAGNTACNSYYGTYHKCDGTMGPCMYCQLSIAMPDNRCLAFDWYKCNTGGQQATMCDPSSESL